MQDFTSEETRPEPKKSFAFWGYLAGSLLPWLLVAYGLTNSDFFPDPISIVTIAFGAVATYRGIMRSSSWQQTLFVILAVPYVLIAGAAAYAAVASLFH